MKQETYFKLLGIGLLVTSFLLIMFQVIYGFMNFASVTSKRWFVEGMIIMSSVGTGLIYSDWVKALKMGAVTFLVVNALILALGFGLGIYDSTFGTEYMSGNPPIFLLDSMGSKWVMDAKILMDIAVGIVPAIILIIGVVTIVASENANEYQEAGIEIAMMVGLLLIYGVLRWTGVF